MLEIGDPRATGGLATFLRYWRAWHRAGKRPARLHYVLILPQVPDDACLSAAAQTPSPVQGLLRSVLQQRAVTAQTWQRGFQRLELDQGQLLLTVCIGPVKAMLKAQAFQADRVLIAVADPSHTDTPWDRWSTQALARLCTANCPVRLLPGAHRVLASLSTGGFSIQAGPSVTAWRGRFDPPWRGHFYPQSRGHVDPPPRLVARWQRFAPESSTPASCVVIGAGLAGAATAAAMARRGWQVQVIETEPALTRGDNPVASGLPLGLFGPVESKNDAPLSRLIRGGISLLAQRLPALLPSGKGWALTGIAETVFETKPEPTGAARSIGQRWHAQAGWIKPAALVQALLSTPGVMRLSGAHVQRLTHDGKQWQVLGPHDALVARADLLVLAAGGASAALLSTASLGADSKDLHQDDIQPDLQAARGVGLNNLGERLQSLHPIAGQISWAPQVAHESGCLPMHPVNGYGHLSAHVPLGAGQAWYLGATYEPGGSDAQHPARVQAAHDVNLKKLSQLAPQCASLLAPRFAQGEVNAWRGIRYATRDRLPVVGPWSGQPSMGLWINTGLGSRGLSWCLLNAELVAAQVCGEPLPIEAKLAAALAP